MVLGNASWYWCYLCFRATWMRSGNVFEPWCCGTGRFFEQSDKSLTMNEIGAKRHWVRPEQSKWKVKSKCTKKALTVRLANCQKDATLPRKIYRPDFTWETSYGRNQSIFEAMEKDIMSDFGIIKEEKGTRSNW
jgi:hypothetical protein